MLFLNVILSNVWQRLTPFTIRLIDLPGALGDSVCRRAKVNFANSDRSEFQETPPTRQKYRGFDKAISEMVIVVVGSSTFARTT